VIVLDTNVLSELMRREPEPRVVGWFRHLPGGSLYTTAITRAELLFGVGLLPNGKRKAALSEAVAAIFAIDLNGRVLPFDIEASDHFAQVACQSRAQGLVMSDADARIEAIASSRGAQLATRNVADFAACGVPLLNPWEFRTRLRRR
jgi:predicted nucleic acid-binding protein